MKKGKPATLEELQFLNEHLPDSDANTDALQAATVPILRASKLKPETIEWLIAHHRINRPKSDM